MTYYEELAATFKTDYGCTAYFLHPVPVRQIFPGNKIWDGAVWLFSLTGHSKARFAYAWLHPNDAGDNLEITTVLEIPPVDSAQTAVWAARTGHHADKSHLIITAHPFDPAIGTLAKKNRGPGSHKPGIV